MAIDNLEKFILDRKSSTMPEIDGLTGAEQMAYITHYISNMGTDCESCYERGRELYVMLTGKDPKDGCSDFSGNLKVNFECAEKPKFTFIDLFAGIGGFRIAMQKCGGKCVFSSEFDPNAQKTYSFNYGEVPFGDITDRRIKDAIPEKFDILCGGFPCQAFSVAGLRRGFEDTRGTLFFDVAEIIKEHRPKAIFLENVRNLETHDNGQTFGVIRKTLEDLGYVVSYKILNACEYGNVPQTRNRILIVGFNSEAVENYADFCFPESVELTKTIHDCLLEEKQADKYYYKEDSRYYPQLSETMKSKDTVYQWRRVYVRENKSRLCPTLTANMGTGGHNVPLILTDWGIRKLTPKECLNFMGYPEDYAFPDSISESACYKQSGNSVVVPVMMRVAEQIAKVLYGEQK